jgi:hypothetical protein
MRQEEKGLRIALAVGNNEKNSIQNPSIEVS